MMDKKLFKFKDYVINESLQELQQEVNDLFADEGYKFSVKGNQIVLQNNSLGADERSDTGAQIKSSIQKKLEEYGYNATIGGDHNHQIIVTESRLMEAGTPKEWLMNSGITEACAELGLTEDDRDAIIDICLQALAGGDNGPVVYGEKMMVRQKGDTGDPIVLVPQLAQGSHTNEEAYENVEKYLVDKYANKYETRVEYGRMD